MKRAFALMSCVAVLGTASVAFAARYSRGNVRATSVRSFRGMRAVRSVPSYRVVRSRPVVVHRTRWVMPRVRPVVVTPYTATNCPYGTYPTTLYPNGVPTLYCQPY